MSYDAHYRANWSAENPGLVATASGLVGRTSWAVCERGDGRVLLLGRQEVPIDTREEAEAADRLAQALSVASLDVKRKLDLAALQRRDAEEVKVSDTRILYAWEGYPAGERMRTLMGSDPISCSIVGAGAPPARIATRRYVMPENDLAAQEILRLVAENAALRKRIAALEAEDGA